MEFTITPMGAPFPALLPPCEWEMISSRPPSISYCPTGLTAFPLPETSLTLNLITLSLHFILLHSHTNTLLLLYCLYLLVSLFFLTNCARLYESDKL